MSPSMLRILNSILIFVAGKQLAELVDVKIATNIFRILIIIECVRFVFVVSRQWKYLG